MKLVLTLSIITLFAVNILAQQPAGTKVVQRSVKLEDLVIRDSTGILLPANVVQAFMATGKYKIRFATPGGTEGVLLRYTADELTRNEANRPRPKESNFFKDGAAFSPFSEKDMNGSRHNLKELAGKVVVLNFWFINCPPCRKEIPDLNDIVDKYKDNKDVVFIAVALDEKYDLNEFLKTTPFKYNIIDNGTYVAQKYRVNLFPTHVVLDKQGKILFHTSGLYSGTVPWLKKSIEAGLNNTELK